MAAKQSCLYVTDLDGTLLNRQDRISDYSIQVLNHLVEEGMHFTYATARSLSSALVVAEGLTPNIPVIVYNGAFIRNAATGEELYRCIFQKDEADKVSDFLRQRRIYPLVYRFWGGEEKVSWLRGRENEGMNRYLSLRQNDKRMTVVQSEEQLYDGDIFYFTCIGQKEELQPVYDHFNGEPEYTCLLQQELYREEYWCEIMQKKATKANAVLKLKELLRCERVVCFGDAVNDLPMFQISDESYAVANAIEELKREATGVIASNEEDGVARWLLEHSKQGGNML